MALAYFVRTERVNFRQYFSKIFTIVVTALDSASLLDGAGETQSITVTGGEAGVTDYPAGRSPGLQLGDMVLGISLGVSTVGFTIVGSVSAADTLQLRVQNESGSTVELADTTVTVLIGRPNPVMFRGDRL